MPISAILSIVKFLITLAILATLIVRIFLGVRQARFFGRWVMLELNMLAFLALVGLSKERAQSSALKYFMIQRVGSRAFLLGLRLSLFSGLSEHIASLIGIGLFLKLGASPFHGWFINFIGGVDWGIFYVSSRIQKVLPIYLLYQVNRGILRIVVLARIWIRVVGRVGQLDLKKLLAYSSVFGGAWIIRCNLAFEVSMLYLLIYALSLLPLLWLVLLEETLTVNRALRLNDKARLLLILVTLLNLGGTPPFIGFYAKVAVIVTLSNRSQLITLLRLVGGSIFLLYVYLQILIKALATGSAKVRLFEVKNRRVSGSLAAALILRIIAIPLLLRIGVSHKKIWTFRY